MPTSAKVDEVGHIPFDTDAAMMMIDRFVHYAEVLTLPGTSYRTRTRQLPAKDRDR